jgi:hypothetical protein
VDERELAVEAVFMRFCGFYRRARRVRLEPTSNAV